MGSKLNFVGYQEIVDTILRHLFVMSCREQVVFTGLMSFRVRRSCLGLSTEPYNSVNTEEALFVLHRFTLINVLYAGLIGHMPKTNVSEM